MYGRSRIFKYNKLDHRIPLTINRSEDMDKAAFGEGADYFIEKDDVRFLQLTWWKRYISKCDEIFNQIKQLKLPKELKEGWGLTHDPSQTQIYLATDGSHRVYEINFGEEPPKVIKTHRITDKDSNNVDQLNELEFIDGVLWANRYLTNEIVLISLESDKVIKTLDLSHFVNKAKEIHPNVAGKNLQFDECLNGIAYEKETNTLLVTGKNWRVVFQIQLMN